MVNRNKFLGLGPRRKFEEEAVVLLHDLYSSKKSMTYIENRLKKDGFVVYNIFPTGSNTVIQLAGSLKIQLYKMATFHRRIHFVTHDIGGVILQKMLSMMHDRSFRSKIGRIVLIEFPDNSSELMNGVLHGKFKNFVIKLLCKNDKKQRKNNKILIFPENQTLSIIGTKDHKVNNIEPSTGNKIKTTVVCIRHYSILKHNKTIEETSFFIRKLT